MYHITPKAIVVSTKNTSEITSGKFVSLATRLAMEPSPAGGRSGGDWRRNIRRWSHIEHKGVRNSVNTKGRPIFWSGSDCAGASGDSGRRGWPRVARAISLVSFGAAFDPFARLSGRLGTVPAVTIPGDSNTNPPPKRCHRASFLCPAKSQIPTSPCRQIEVRHLTTIGVRNLDVSPMDREIDFRPVRFGMRPQLPYVQMRSPLLQGIAR